MQRVGAMHRRAFGLRPVPPLPSRPFGFNPSRLRACGAARWRLPPGDQRKAHPRRAQLGAPRRPPNRRCRIDQVSAFRRRRAGRIRCRLLWQVVRMWAALNAGGSCPSRHETVHGHTARHPYGASMPCLKARAERCGRGVLACRRGIDRARVKKRDGEAFVRGCRVVPVSFRREVRPKASLSRCESWRWRGYASCFMAATVRRKQFPLRYAHSSRGKLFSPTGSPLRYDRKRCSQPVPRRPDHNKDAMGANLV